MVQLLILNNGKVFLCTSFSPFSTIQSIYYGLQQLNNYNTITKGKQQVYITTNFANKIKRRDVQSIFNNKITLINSFKNVLIFSVHTIIVPALQGFKILPVNMDFIFFDVYENPYFNIIIVYQVSFFKNPALNLLIIFY